MNDTFLTNLSISSEEMMTQPPSHCCGVLSPNVIEPSDDYEDIKLMDKPKRPLSAYNVFFRFERSRLLRKIDDSALVIQKKEDGNINLQYAEEDTSQKPKLCVEDVRKQLDMIDISTQATDKRRRHRKGHGKFGFTELIRYIGKTWSSLDDESRQVFELLATEERNNYREKMRKYKITKRKISKRKQKSKKTHKSKVRATKFHNQKKIPSKNLLASLEKSAMTITPSITTSYNNSVPRILSSNCLSQRGIEDNTYASFPVSSRDNFAIISRQNTLLRSLIGQQNELTGNRSLDNDEERDLAEFLLEFDWDRF